MTERIAEYEPFGRSAKTAFRSGCAIAALLGSVGMTAPVQAQAARPPGMIVENIPHATMAPVFIAPVPFAAAPPVSSTQAFQATTAFAGYTPDAAAGLNDVVTLTADETIITWNPLDTATLDTTSDAISILPGGRSITFSRGSDFTVLNRIIPTANGAGDFRAIQFDGTVNSLVGGVTGGNVWFYSPGGIIVSNTGVFDVGALVLTTNDIDTSGGLFGTDGEIRFRGAAGSSSAIVIESGASLQALNDGSSYVALVAPRVVQGGDVNVDGSVAYVAAEQADLTINSGLFDITVTVGTTDANGIVHTGTTRGPAETPTPAGAGGIPPAVPDPQAIYLVTVAKNDAVTMLVSGNLGYTAAVGATQEDGEIILSGGYDVGVGGSSSAPVVEFSENATGAGNVGIEFGAAATTLTNDLTAQATGAIDLILSGTTLAAQQGLTLRSDTFIGLGAHGGGGLTVGNNLVLDVSAVGAVDTTPGSNGADASAGGIRIDIGDGGSLDVTGTTNLLADATAGLGTDSAGRATGGSITLLLSGTGTIDTGILLASAQGKNSTGSGNPDPLRGGDAVGGTITVNISGGTLTGTQMALDASATAQPSNNTDEISNDATAGDIAVSITGGTHSLDFLTLRANADAADSYDAAGTARDGLATGGALSLLIDNNARLTIANTLAIDTETSGQTSAATAGSIGLTVRNGGDLDVGGSIDLSVAAQGGNPGVVNQAGTIDILADNGTITADDFFLNASSFLGDFGGANPADAAAGGTIDIMATGGGSLTVTGFSSINAGANATNASDGATAQGGDILFDANGGTIQFGGSMFVNASGIGNSNSDPSDISNRGSGTGGTITYRVRGTAGSMTLGNVFADADGSVEFDVESGAAEPIGEGGTGVGGQILFDLLGGSFFAADLNIGADGSGGPGGGDTMPVAPLSLPAPLSPAGEPSLLFATNFIGRPVPLGPAGFAPFALATDPAARGGDGTGGTVTFNLNGATATVTNLSISANGAGGAGGDGDGPTGVGAGDGGDGFGGTATFNAISGMLTVTNTLTVAATGNSATTGGSGGRGFGADAGNGGNGFGGTATFNLVGAAANISATDVVVSTEGFGGSGGNAFLTFDGGGNEVAGGIAGNGGTGTGGNAVFNNTAGTLNFLNTLTVSANGNGGGGGSNTGNTIGDARDVGGDGGDGVGGTATINVNQTDASVPDYTVSADAAGGTGGQGTVGGDGGDAAGGTAEVVVTGVSVALDETSITADATGGAGALADLVSGNGGNGGSATGGTARVEVTGAGGAVSIGGSNFIVSSDGTGGAGADGYNAFLADGGDGGAGGDGTGGRSELIARTGGTLTITTDPFDLNSRGNGGAGGNGGYSYNMVAGDASAGGSGTGGTAQFLAQGGTITSTDVNVLVTGAAGAGGTGGGTFLGTAGANGVEGSGAGGTGIIEVQEGSSGIITMGAVIVQANGLDSIGAISPTALGGTVIIADTSVDPLGLITFAALDITALAAAGAPGSGVFISSNSGPITVTGDATIDAASNVEFSFDGNGQMTVGGNMTIASGQDILLDHANNGVPTESIDVAGDFTADAQGDFDATTGSRIVAGRSIDIRAEGAASAAKLTAVDRIALSAGQDATLGDGTVTGGSSAVIRIDAGSDGDPTTPTYDPTYNATITGAVASTGNMLVFAGGNAIFQTGATVGVDNRVQVQTGDDIIVQSGATVQAGLNPAVAPNPADPFNDLAILNFDAGTINLGSPILTPISSIVIAGTLEAANTAVVLNANAIDGLGGTINAGSISADVADAPANSIAQSGDNGLLSGVCVEGNVCLGTLVADNIVQVGQASNNDVIRATIEGGAVSADTILVTTRSDVVIGTDGVASRFEGASQVLLESLEGDVDLRNATIVSDLVQISTASGSLLGSGSIASANDVGITVARDVFAASIDAGGELTTVADIGGAPEGQYSVPGTIVVGAFSQGIGDANIDAGGTIRFDQVNVSSGNDIILLTAGGDVFLGGTSGATNISIFGLNVEIGSIAADDTVDITAAGDISGSDSSSGSQTTLDAGGTINLSGLSSGGNIMATAVDILRLTDADAAGDIMLSADLVSVRNLNAGNAIDIRAAVGASITTGNAGSTFSFDAGDINFGTLTSGDAMTLLADSGFITGLDIDAGTTLTVDVPFLFEFRNITVGQNATIDAGDDITGVSVTVGGNLTADGNNGFEVDTLSVDGDAALRSLNGAVVVNTDISVTGELIASGAAILLNAIGDLGVTDTRATNGNIDIIAGGDLAVAAARSVGDINLTSTGGSVSAGAIEAGLVTVAPASATAGGAQVPFGRVVGSPGVGDITFTAAADAIITADAIANNDLFISAGDLIDIQAVATGVTVTTDSADFDIGSRGQLGTSNLTRDIEITSNGTSAMVLGGTGTAGAFSLDADEFTRIFSGGDLTIFATVAGAGAPSLVIENLTAQVATGAGGTRDGTIGGAGTLTIATEGDMRVNGALALTGATSANTLAILADQDIRVDANGGNIAITDANGGLAGRLALSAGTITAATDAATADIAGATVAEADARLASNDGVVRDDGFFQADGITFTVDSGIFIQNSAAGTDFADRRGFVVSDGGITIAGATAGGTVGIVVNGIQRLSSGTTITGIDMIAQTMLNTGFAAASTINGCLIGAPATCGATVRPPPTTPDTPNEPVQDLIEEEIEEEDDGLGMPTTQLIETVEIFPSREGPIIDDPVTGSGNEDLWIRNPVGGGMDD